MLVYLVLFLVFYCFIIFYHQKPLNHSNPVFWNPEICNFYFRSLNHISNKIVNIHTQFLSFFFFCKARCPGNEPRNAAM